MALAHPISTDKLDSPDHTAMHNIVAVDTAAPTDSIGVASTGIATFAETPVIPATAPVSNTQVANKKYVDDQIASAIPSGYTYSGASAFSGTAPSTWTNLDLSAIVGANRALVFLKVKNTGVSGNMEVKFRMDGDSEEVGYNDNNSAPLGVTGSWIQQGYIAYLWVQTSAAGIVEWKTSNTHSAAVTLLSYIK